MRLRSVLRLGPFSIVGVAAFLILAGLTAAYLIAGRLGERIIVERDRAAAEAQRDYLAEVDREEGRSAMLAALARRERVAERGERFGLFQASGEPVAGRMTRLSTGPRAGWSDASRGSEASPDGVLRTRLSDGAWLVVAPSAEGRERFEAALQRTSLAAGAVVLLAGLAAGLVLNGLMLRRAELVAATAEKIASGDFSARVPESVHGGAFGRIGHSMNLMLERVEELMTGMRTVTDSLAHDLRSPLTRMRGAMGRALDERADEGARRAALAQAYAEADRTLATINALLDVARAESGLSREDLRPVDVGAVAVDMAELFEPLLEDAGQSLEAPDALEPVVVRGHEALLRQALGNLLHNAAAHAGRGAHVRVEVSRDDDRIRLIVSDDGPGVAPDQRGRVQERFVRQDSARSTPGSGLGLAIAAACAKLHGGRLLLEDAEPGLRAVLELSPGYA